MARKKVLFFILLLTLTINVFSIKKNDHANDLKIYIFNEKTDIKTILNDYSHLRKTIIISHEDIKSYNWATHEIIINQKKWEEIKNLINEINSKDIYKIPFVFLLGNEILYYGNIWKQKYDGRDSFISTIHLIDLENNLFKINASSFMDNYIVNNIINNKQLFQYLKKTNLLSKKINYKKNKKFKYKPISSTYYMLPMHGRLQLIFEIENYFEDIYNISIFDAKLNKILYSKVSNLFINHNILYFNFEEKTISIQLYDIKNKLSDEYLIINFDKNIFDSEVWEK